MKISGKKEQARKVCGACERSTFGGDITRILSF
jgi:hypothetical protein